MNKHYTVLLKDGTTGMMKSDSINDQEAADFIGETVRVKLNDGTEVEGVLVEVLEVSDY